MVYTGRNQMRSAGFVQTGYDSLVQEIYMEILKKEGYKKEHRAFVKKENNIIRSVEFSSFYDGKKGSLRFQICVEARLENETILRREGKLTSGEGAYRKFFPGLPKRSFWTGKIKYSEEDLKILEVFRIGGQTDLTGVKALAESLVSQALEDMRQFHFEEELTTYLNVRQDEDAKSLAAFYRKHTLFEFIAYGLMGAGVWVVSKDWFVLIPVWIIYYILILEDMDLTDRWFRRMLVVPVVELAVMGVLFYLLWQKITDDYEVGRLCIGMFVCGFVHLVDYIYNIYARKRREELYHNRRFWGGA